MQSNDIKGRVGRFTNLHSNSGRGDTIQTATNGDMNPPSPYVDDEHSSNIIKYTKG